MNIDIAIRQATLLLKKFDIKSPLLDSEILMSKAIQKDRKFIILNQNYKISKISLNFFKSLVSQRSLGMPISYLTKKKFFWKHEFNIDKDILIPRPDTELIVEETLKLMKHKKNIKILEIGSGSGCIILSILDERKDFTGIGIDISKKCVDLSKKNTFKIGLKNNIKFLKSNVDNFNYGKYDLIISNPPYINQYDLKYLEKDVINFEPKLALNGGLDGLSEIRKVIKKSSELIKIKGKLILEIGFDQKERVKKLLNKKGFYINKIIKDLAKNDRCIICTKI
jgi:release factor glutamine methyltransferase